MATKTATVGWEKVRQFERDGKNFVVWTDGERDIALPLNQSPTPKTLELLAINGIDTMVDEPIAVDEVQPAEVEEIPESALERAIKLVSDNRDPNARPGEVRVLKIVDDAKKPAYCNKYTPEEWENGGDYEIVRRQFGPGTYVIEVWGTTPTHDASGQRIKSGGKFVNRARERVDIVSSLIALKADEKMPNDVAGSLAPILAQMERMQQQFLEHTKQNQRDPFLELQKLAQLQALFNPQGMQPQKSSVRELLDGVRDLKEAGELFGNQDKGPGDLLTIGSELIGTIREVAKSQQPQASLAAAPGEPLVRLPASMRAPTEPAAPDDQQQSEPPEGVDNVNAFQQMGLLAVVRSYASAAAQKKDVEEYAQGMLDMLPDEALGMLSLPTWFEVLSDMMPDVGKLMAPHLEWFTQLRNRILVIAREGA